VYAIKAAGLASAIGISSCCIVLSSFTWGIFVFEEKVHSRAGACCAVFCLMMGLIGMSYYSSPERKPGNDFSADASQGLVEVAPPKRIDVSLRSSTEDEYDASDHSGTGRNSAPNSPALTKRGRKSYTSRLDSRCNSFNDVDCVKGDSTSNLGSVVDGPLLTKRGKGPLGIASSRSTSFNDTDYVTDDSDDEEILALIAVEKPTSTFVRGETVVVFGRKLPKREWGMFLAGICGLWGGSVMAPMKLCPADTKGSRFLLSFSIGASIVQIGFWLVRYLYNVHQHQSFKKAYAALPSFHIRVMWLPGGISGLLWSTGNFFSLITVYYLGQGIGYSLVQAQLLVSGLWGIFFFKEIQNTDRILKWLLSSVLTLGGILLLSYEHVDE